MLSYLELIIVVFAVWYFGDKMGLWFYVCIVMMAYSLQNIWNGAVNTIYISKLNFYIYGDEAYLLYYGIMVLAMVIVMIVCKRKKDIVSLFKCGFSPLLVVYTINSKCRVIWIIMVTFVIIMTLGMFIGIMRSVWKKVRKHRKKYGNSKFKRNRKLDKKSSIKILLNRAVCIIEKRSFSALVVAAFCCVCLSKMEAALVLDEFVEEIKLYEVKRSLGGRLIEEIDKYGAMSVEERFDVLKLIVDREAKYLGIESEYAIVKENLPEGLDAWFDKSKMVIVIDEPNIMEYDLEESIVSCIHELYHLYQYELVYSIDWSNVESDLRVIREAEQWKNEFEGYRTVDNTSCEEYEGTLLESAARDFSIVAAKEYMQLISEGED